MRNEEIEQQEARPDGDAGSRAEGTAADERSLAELRQLRALLEAMPVPVFYKDAAGRYLGCNRAYEAFFALRRDEFVGRTVEELWPPDLARIYRGADDALFAAGGAQVYEAEVRAGGGALRDVIFHKALFQESGRPAGLVGAVLDVTDRKDAQRALAVREREEEALREADRHKSEFLALLSHELRNPLAPIRNSIHLLERLPSESPQAAHARQVIRRQTEQLARLVDDLLDVTRISRGKIQIQPAVVDLAEVVRRSCEDHRALLEQSGLELRLDFPTGPVWADVDSHRIAQVVGNLLDNANKFTPAKGSVSVALRVESRRAQIRIRDTGMGIEPGRVSHMFEAFAQEDRCLARTRGGLGLGLALAKGIVELHGGRIEAHSEGAGRGSEFALELPLAGAGAEAAQLPASQAGRAPAGRSVLIIEDNLDAAESLAQVLELEGHRVRVARDGTTGIALAREQRPDVVLCDIGLPDVDGHEVARALRQDEGLGATRLIALSGYTQAEDKLRAREAGFDGHMGKPAPVSELIALLA